MRMADHNSDLQNPYCLYRCSPQPRAAALLHSLELWDGAPPSGLQEYLAFVRLVRLVRLVAFIPVVGFVRLVRFVAFIPVVAFIPLVRFIPLVGFVPLLPILGLLPSVASRHCRFHAPAQARAQAPQGRRHIAPGCAVDDWCRLALGGALLQGVVEPVADAWS